MQYTTIPPHSFAGALHSQDTTAERCLVESEQTFKHVHKVEQIIRGALDDDDDADLLLRPDSLTQLFEHCWFTKLQLVRELWALFEPHRDGQWKVHDEIYENLYIMFSGKCNTKTLLEDVFNRLRDMNRDSRCNATSLWRSAPKSDLKFLNYHLFIYRSCMHAPACKLKLSSTTEFPCLGAPRISSSRMQDLFIIRGKPVLSMWPLPTHWAIPVN